KGPRVRSWVEDRGLGLTMRCGPDPRRDGGEFQAPGANRGDELGEDRRGVGVVVVQEDDVAAPGGAGAQPIVDLAARAAREVLGVDVPEDDRLAGAPEAPELGEGELAVRRSEQPRGVAERPGEQVGRTTDLLEEPARGNLVGRAV